MVKIEYAIAHCQWDERRHATLRRLIQALPGTGMLFDSREPEHANVWAKRVWSVVATWDSAHPDTGGTVILNDDVIPHPELLSFVAQLCELLPGRFLSLHCQFPQIEQAAFMGTRLARCYWPSGPAMFFPRGFARKLLDWLETVPPQWFAGDVNEDGAIASFLWSQQTPAFCSIPALVRHDTTVPSTLGYDGHPNRTSPVDWETYPVRPWTSDDVESAPHIDVPWLGKDGLRHLGDALRGVYPLCGLCHNAASALMNDRRKTGVCGGCARKVAEAVGKAEATP